MAPLVLVVDDDLEIRDAIEDVLGLEWYDVASAGDGEDALGWLRSAARLPSVILLDVMMPRMDGQSFRRALLAEPALAPIPVVVLTASLATEPPGPLQGAVVLPKPFTIDALLATIAGALSESASGAEVPTPRTTCVLVR